MDSKRKFLISSLVCMLLFSVVPVFAATDEGSGSGNSTNENSTVPLTVDFTANVTNGTAPLNVMFTSNCTGNPIKFNWTFGDGTYSDSNLTAIHTYSNPGKYNVSVTISNATDNKTLTKIDYINVSKASSVKERILCSGKAPLRVVFLDRSKKHISTYWNFGDGKASRSRNTVHIYKKPGKYPVTWTYVTVGHVKKTLHVGHIIVK
jgi:PKD repeat protein